MKIHTLTITNKLDYAAYSNIAKNLKTNRFWKQIPDGMESWCMCNDGITKIKLQKVEKPSIVYYKIELIISAKRTLEPGNFIDLLDVKDFPKMAEKVNFKLQEISVKIPKIETFSVKRVDFCENINMGSHEPVEAYISTLRRCNFPKGLERTGMYDQAAKRWKPFPNAFTFGANGHVEVAVYDKQHEMKNEKDGAYPGNEIERSRGIVRFEVRCKKGKVKALKKTYRFRNVKEFFQKAETIVNRLFLYYFSGIAGSGRFMTIKRLKKEIKKLDIKLEKKELMVELAERINISRNASCAIEDFVDEHGKACTRSVLKLFDENNLNYVTLTEKSESVLRNFIKPYDLVAGGEMNV